MYPQSHFLTNVFVESRYFKDELKMNRSDSDFSYQITAEIWVFITEKSHPYWIWEAGAIAEENSEKIVLIENVWVSRSDFRDVEAGLKCVSNNSMKEEIKSLQQV